MVEAKRRWFGCCGGSRNDGAMVTHDRYTTQMGSEKSKEGSGMNEEDDLQAVRSWRRQRNTSSALVIVNVEPKLQRIDEDDENSLSLPPPIEEIEEIPPSSPLTHSVERAMMMPEMDVDRAANKFSHLSSGGFPTFTAEEEEWRKQQGFLKDSYLSSSSASTSSTVEDPVLRRSPVALDESFDTGVEGPVDLDRLEDHLLLNASLSRRPEPDDGDVPPLNAFSSLTHSNEEFISPSKDSSSLDWKNMDLMGLHNSSDELDAMVAAIDHGLEATPRNVSPPVRLSPSRRDSPRIFDPALQASASEMHQSSSPTAAETAQHRRRARNRVASVTDTYKQQPIITSKRTPAPIVLPSENLDHASITKDNQNMLSNTATQETNNVPLDEPMLASLPRNPAGQASSPRENTSSYSLQDSDIRHSSPDGVQIIVPANEPMNEPMLHSVLGVPHSAPKRVLKDLLSEETVHTSSTPADCDEDYDMVHRIGDQSASLRIFEKTEDYDDDDDEDRLSNIPSEADPLQKERYLKACRILKAALLEKNSLLPASDQKFLEQLLLETTPSKDDSDQLTEERVRLYESTAQQLRASPPLMDNATSIVSTDGGVLNVKWEDPDIKTIPPPYQLPGVTERALQRHDHRFPGASMSQRSSPSQVSSSLFSRVDQDDYPFQWIGGDISSCYRNQSRPQVLTTRLMGVLRGFLPDSLRSHNFWWKFAWDARDPPPLQQQSSLQSLLREIQFTSHTIICVETVNGHVFGAFCSSPWRLQETWFGSEDCFLWRLKHPRLEENSRDDTNDNEMEIYPYTGADDLIQYCTAHTLAVGGGTDWSRLVEGGCPYGPDEPSGIGFLLDGDLMGGETSACTTFANPRLGNREDGGGNEFDIRYLEVWTLTPCAAVKEAQENELSMHVDEEEDADQRTSSDF